MRATWMATAVTLLVSVWIGSCNKVEVSFDCPGLCRQLKSCVNSLLDVTTCSERCYARVSTDDVLREQVDTCADCIERGYACDELESRCKSCRPAAETILRDSAMRTPDASDRDAD